MEEILRDTSGDERDSEGRVKRRARLVWAEEEISFSFSFFSLSIFFPRDFNYACQQSYEASFYLFARLMNSKCMLMMFFTQMPA